MKFAHFSQPWDRPDMPPAMRYEQMWREVELADKLGFDFGFHSVHHFHKLRPPTTVYCTATAARTKRIRLGPMGYIVPLYEPMRIVEEASILDNILDGRLELGLVCGAYPEYFRIQHVDWEQRRTMTNEAVLLIKTAFAGGPFSFKGPYHEYHDVNLSVRPIQRPHPPLWMQSGDPETVRFLAKEGVHAGYFFTVNRKEMPPLFQEYVELWDQAGHEGKPNISYETFVYVDETDEAALTNGTRHVLEGMDWLYGNKTSRGVNESPRDRTGSEILSNVGNIEYLLDRNIVFLGSPETVVKRIRSAAKEGFFNTLLCEFNIGFISEAELMRSIKLFGERVIPALRGFDPTN